MLEPKDAISGGGPLFAQQQQYVQDASSCTAVYSFTIDGLKCLGCASRLKNHLLVMDSDDNDDAAALVLDDVVVDFHQGTIK
ncbi:UNVERIFIED_CONTAM: hypothetical protein HDU68_003306, partial [Siphonaria sp. JEL0065]